VQVCEADCLRLLKVFFRAGTCIEGLQTFSAVCTIGPSLCSMVCHHHYSKHLQLVLRERAGFAVGLGLIMLTHHANLQRVRNGPSDAPLMGNLVGHKEVEHQ